MQTQPSLRERKKEATREALIHSAYPLFQDRGFDAVTIDELAESVDIGRRTFFRYFPTKEAIVFPRQAERLVRFQAALAASGPGLPGVRQACLGTAAIFSDARDEFLAQGRIIRSSTTLIAHEATLDLEWQDAIAAHLGQTLPETQSAFLAGATMGLVRSVLRTWRDRGCTDDLNDLGDQAFALLNGALSL